MIRGMVARLADRLRDDGADVEGWVRLVRAYVVLGDRDKAKSAAADAKRALGATPRRHQAHRRSGQRSRARRLTEKTCREHVSHDPQAATPRFDRRRARRARDRGCADAQRVSRFHRVLQFAERRRGETHRARHPHPARRLGQDRQPRARRQSESPFRRHRRQSRHPGRLSGRVARSVPRRAGRRRRRRARRFWLVQGRHHSRQARRDLHAEGSRRRVEEVGTLEGRYGQPRGDAGRGGWRSDRRARPLRADAGARAGADSGHDADCRRAQ